MKKILFCLALASFAACTPSNSQSPSTQTTTSQRDPLPQLNRATAALLSSNQAFAHSISQAPTKNKTYTQIADAAHQINYLSAKFCKDANPDVNPAAAYAELSTNIEKQLKAVSSDVSLGFYTIRQDQADALFKKSTFGGQRPELLADADFQKLSTQERSIYTAQLQSDAAAGANELLSFIGEQVDDTDIKLTQFTILSSPSKNVVTLGETFEAEIMLGAYTTNSTARLQVNGTPLPVENGVATFKVKPSTLGEQSYKATIFITNPMTGEQLSFMKEFNYQVVK